MSIAHAGDTEQASQAHNNLGVVYLSQNNLTAAIGEFDKAISINPYEMNSYLARGTVEYQLGKMDAALADFMHASSLGRSPIAYYWLGRAYEAKGDFPHAKSAYDIALQLAPSLQDARARLQFLKALGGQ